MGVTVPQVRILSSKVVQDERQPGRTEVLIDCRWYLLGPWLLALEVPS